MTTTPDAARRDRNAARLTIASVAGSLVMAIALFAVHVFFHSQLALAQAADSLSDMLAGSVLAWAIRQSAQPADDDHPHGHSRAEPIAALIVAVLAGVLSIEVLRAAVLALVAGAEPELDAPVALVFAAKVVFKIGIAVTATRWLRQRANPAIDALRVDARNDVLVGSVAVVGFVVALSGLPAVDSVLAIATALYVGASGLRLARENIELLMGASAPVDRRAELTNVAGATPGVVRTDALTATWHGADLHVYVEVAVERSLSLLDAHAIGHAVEERLSREDDVARAVVHVGPA